MTPHRAAALAPTRSMRAFVWDLADEGIHAVLDHLHELGINGLSLAMAYHGGRFYCPHNPRRSMVHAPDGALYFQPMLSCYEGLRPRIHPEYGSGAFAARVGEALREMGMSWTAWVVLFNNMSLSAAHPAATCHNALGDRLEGTLCPSNPACRVYAQALIEDLAHRVEVDAIELEDFAFPSHESYVGARWMGAPIEPWLGYLLSLCFCEHCRRRAEEANIEVDDLAYHVERMLRAALRGDLSDRRIADEIADPYNPISRYAMVRAETITSLLEELQEAAAGGPRPVALQPILTEQPDDVWRWGIEPHVFRQYMLRAAIHPCRGQQGCQAFVERYQELLHLGHDLSVDISLLEKPGCEKISPSQMIEACEKLGIERFIFSNYGLASMEMLESVAMQPKR